MRISASALVRWAAVLAAVYMAGLGLWRLLEPIYMRLLAGGVATLDFVGVLPTAVQAIVVPGKGLASWVPESSRSRFRSASSAPTSR